ncbi:MAG: copper-binding protein [Henriciella sp.]|uniref:copper resistance system multicopper oxidase n=1 Tax=Henriciella sp. TaxID=1968823 RepID=UPI000C0F52D5|nr:copper resistance system multicopper oxidase [Henriciella sp.]MAN73076.1 copper-binding protein [Henriciella sp.]MBF34795.1 copper-binding protein [Hyphomonadaceae bacterium]MBK75749.1 copper-binding protein [Henriciella sp.]PHR81272.1 MAG: copper-binding protein [Henriciella sp.]
MFNRRHLLQTALGAGAAYGATSLLPAWARSASRGNLGIPSLAGTEFDLDISRFPVRIGGKAGLATGINGTLPAPLLRFREGDDVTLNVTNRLDEDTSIHWHGLLVPFHMDGVPGVSFPGIKPGETFSYKFRIPQNGTYWYHSHSGLQEQLGHYGPIVIDPKDADPVAYDREYVLVLSDWSFTSPHRLYGKLKKNAESLNFNQPTLTEPTGLGGMWGQMRMSPRDLADVTGATYTYLINGQSTEDNFNMVFRPGEKVRLRIVNAAAMTLFNVRIPGLPMTVVQSDGLNIQPVETDEFQMGVAETYDIIVEPTEERAYAFVAESIDRSGQAVATLGPRPGMRAEEPEMRAVPMLTMRDMGMDHSMMGGMSGMDDGNVSGMDHDASEDMTSGTKDHSGMSGHEMGNMAMKPDPHGPSVQPARKLEADIQRGPGVANVAAMPMSRLDEPGIGLDDVPHRTLTYSQLRALEMNEDHRPPGREIVVHLTSNMERYMWSFDGVKFSEVTESIKFYEGERVRLTLINDTMMPHPIHLHGMFFDLVNGGGHHLPRKHTVIVKPADKVSVDISAEHVGDWAFHCHLLYHMHAGMMQVVSVIPEAPADTGTASMDHENMNHGEVHS